MTLKLFRDILFLVSACIWSSCSKTYTVVNKGVAGNTSSDLLQRLERDVVGEQPGIVIIMVGTNDMINSNKFVSYHDFSDNYQRIIDKLKSTRCALVLMIPPPVDSGYIFKRHKKSAFDRDPNAKIDSAGTIIRALASRNSVGLIDLNRLFRERGEPHREASSITINESNSGKEDGIHPTEGGYRLMAGEVYSYLKRNRLLRKNAKIVCFGDSMTYGAFMAGAGTAEGNTYPAFLKALLNKK
jgi:lysophospholipase L1-like esterase